MGRRAFNNFGIAAERTDSYTIAASRYFHQAQEEKNIVNDVIRKLKITSKDDCLDIGCNTGNILIPLSFYARSITGIDHPKCLLKLKKRAGGRKNIFLIPGNFLDIKIAKTFDKIIVYSVIQYLRNRREVLLFIRKALSLLKPNGKLLLGDIPNTSQESRFYSSREGARYKRLFEKKRAESRKKMDFECIGDLLQHATKDSDYVRLDDAFILDIIAYTRKRGFNAYILPRNGKLPFRNSREDILIEYMERAGGLL